MGNKPKRYVVQVTVDSIRGTCMKNHYPGGKWRITQKIPEGICMGTFASILPAIRTLQFGGTFPWEPEPNATRIAYIDPENQVVFRIECLDETCPA